ncbi:MAG: chemotaxis protein CheW, partial [Deltaproteobacteria bacterium]|nr:chemotaxis protein CheW [Deltaproteobacteria bacterium]
DEKETKPLNLKSAFVFRAGSEWLGLPAIMIREIVPMGPIHSLPNISSDSLRGLVNIHGRLQICVSIGAVLGIAKRAEGERDRDPANSSSARLVLVLQENRPVAFPVTETRGIVHYTPEMIKELPATVSGTKAAYTMGILQLDTLDIGLLKDKPLFKALTKDLK